jgi:hypothetical protein
MRATIALLDYERSRDLGRARLDRLSAANQKRTKRGATLALAYNDSADRLEARAAEYTRAIEILRAAEPA